MTVLLAGFLVLIVQCGCAPLDLSAIYSGQCDRIAELSRTGDHKPAVDQADRLEDYGMTCSPDVQEMTAISRSTLDRANAYAGKALEYKEEDDLLPARINLQSALKIYPKYYWVQELLKNVESSIEEQVAALQNESSSLESGGKTEEALQKLEKARTLSPQREELKSEAARLQSKIKQTDKEEITLTPPENKQDIKQDETGPDHVHEHRLDVIRRGLETAQKAEQSGKLEEAAEHMLHVLKLSSPKEPLTREIVEYTRLLGMKFFSTGNFSTAQLLWQGALKLSPSNSELQGYLKEVEARLDSLEKIKMEEGHQSKM